MYRIALPCCLALMFGLASAHGDSLKDALALEKALQEAIEAAEPAVACILVSRSEAYAKYRTTPAISDSPGKLGEFDLATIKRHYPLTEIEEGQLSNHDMRQPGYVPESYGSGVVIDESGLILTNYHVVKDAAKVFVRLPGDKSSYADIHAADPRSDLAVLRLIKPPGGLQAIKLGDGGKVKKGQMVLTIANPFAAGFRDGSPSASWGIVGNLRRRAAPPTGDNLREVEFKKTLHHYGTLIQTDARLNLGCSGGALIDLKGELIGLTTSLAAISGTDTAGGFAVPMDAGMRRIIEVLKRGEEVEYGFLGVRLGSARGGDGVRLDGVEAWSPAYRGGLRDRDTIISVNGTPVRDNDDLFLAVGTLLAGAEAKIEVRRDSDPVRTLTVTLAKFYVPGPVIASRKPVPVRGLRVDYVSVLLQAMPTFQQPPSSFAGGVVVREVQPASPAANANVKVNDVITHVNGKAVTTPREFYEAAGNVKGALELTLDPGRTVKLN